MKIFEIGFFVVLIALVITQRVMRARAVRLERERFVRRYTFSAELFAKVQEKYPLLEEKDLYLVAKALRQYFLAYLRSGGKTVGMPSRVVDEMWHEFILDTRKYTAFCKKAFGDYFHHIPASRSQKGVPIANGMQLTWRLACLEENLNPGKATRLPLLFAIDEKLKIPNGNIHKRSPQVTGAESGASGCGGIACSGTSTSDASSCCGDGGCSGGCSGGCGGGGD